MDKALILGFGCAMGHQTSVPRRSSATCLLASVLLLASVTPLLAAPPAPFTSNITNGITSVTVDFVPHSIRGAGFQVLVQDAAGALNPVTAPEACTYIGTVNGYPGAVACALKQPNGTVWQHVIFESGQAWLAENNTVTETWGSNPLVPKWPTTAVVTPAQAATVNTVVAGDIIADICYNVFTNQHGSSVDHAVYVTEYNLMQTNLIYLRDLGFLHRTGRVVIRANQSQDPYQTSSDKLGTLRDQFTYTGHEALKYVALSGFGGGLAWVNTVGGAWGASANDVDGMGNVYGYWRHEVGHNHGAYDGHGGGSEGNTLMNGNGKSRLSGPEEASMIGSRSPAMLENLGAYTINLPPRASLDLAYAEPGVPVLIDVLGNDHDSNDDAMSLVSFDPTTTNGGTLTLSAGTGPGGRDQIRYTRTNNVPVALDHFHYRIQDPGGKQSLGNVYVKVTSGISDLAAHWAFDEGSGGTAFSSVGSADAWLSPWHNPPAWVAGRFNTGLSFNGHWLHSLINVSETDYALSLWFRTSQSSGGIYDVNDEGAGYDRNVYLHGGNIHARLSSTDIISSTGKNYGDGQWHQVVHTFGGTEGGQKLYVDGVLVASGTKSQSDFTGQTGIYLGYSTGAPTTYFNGQLDDVRIWNRALSASEVLALTQPGSSWLTPGGGSWATATNWQGNTIASGADTTADFSTLDLTADATVTLDGARTLGNLSFGDTTASHNWTLSTGSGGSLTLATTFGMPAIGVTNQTASIGVPLAGSQGLLKTGAGTLALSGANSFTGALGVNAGTLALGSGGTINNASGITINGGTLLFNGAANSNPIGSANMNIAVNTNGTLAVASTNSMGYTSQGNYANVTLNGGTFNLSANQYINTITLNTGTVSGSGALQFWYPVSTAINCLVSSNITSPVIFNSSAQTISTANEATLTISGAITGMSFTKAGAGSLVLTGANTFSGGLSVNAGSLVFGYGGTINNNVSGITIGNGASVQFIGASNSDTIGSANLPITVNAGGTLAVWTTNSMGYNNQANYANVTLNGGVLALWASQYFNTVTLNGGTVSGSGALQFWYPTATAISAPSSATISAPVAFNSSAQTISTGAGATLTLSGGLYGVGVTKAGTGTLVLSSPSSGPITVSAGTLAGTGTVGGAVTVQSGGTLAPGSGSTGTFTVNNTLTLGGTTTMQVGRTGSTLSTDKVSGVTTLNYGGTLVVTNVGADALQAGDGFQLFSATTYAGSFSSYNLPSLASGLSWNTSRLAVDGTISIQGSVPSGWTAADIGSTGVPGSSNHASGVYTLSGSGAAIGGTADAYHSVSQTLTGDGEIRARITSQTNTNALALAGVMLRNGSAAGDVNACLGLTPGSGFIFQARSSSGGTTTQVGTLASNPAPNNWVRLTRSGSRITSYVSANGTTWTMVGSTTLTMTNVSASLVVNSHDNTVSSTAVFDNVSITPYPVPWLTADIGTTSLATRSEFYNTVHTLNGTGVVGGTADGLRFTYQTLSADGSIVARIPAFANTGSSSRIGVMIRDTLAANSRRVFIGTNGSGVFTWSRRSSTGGGTTSSNSGTATAPNVWVRLVRTNNSIVASTSVNGTTWTQVGTVTIPMASNCYIGLAVGSGNTTGLNASSFDNVTVTP